MATALYDSMVSIVGEQNVSSKEMDLICYSSDLAPLPDTIISSYGMKPPAVVVRPKNADHISAILKFANKERVPVTSRGGASSAMGGCLPMDGGIVLDMTSMDLILSIDEDGMRVTAQSGVTFDKLLQEMKKKNLKPGTYPSSAPSATVGGYISNGGSAGIGAPKYGSISSQIIQLEVVLPDGEILSVNNPLSYLFVGAEGTLGVITKAVLRAYPVPESSAALAYGFNDVTSACGGLRNLSRHGIKPYFLTLMDRRLLEITSRLGIEVPIHEIVISLNLEGKKEIVATQERVVDKIFSNGRKLETAFAEEEWERRYKAELFVKRAGPTIMLVEANVPINRLEETIDQVRNVSKKLGLNACFYGIMTYGRSMLTMPIVLTDERNQEGYFDTMLSALKLTSVIISMGGVIYGVGLHNSIFMELVHDKKRLETMKLLKKTFDPYGIMNPGKLTECRMSWMMALISPR